MNEGTIPNQSSTISPFITPNINSSPGKSLIEFLNIYDTRPLKPENENQQILQAQKYHSQLDPQLYDNLWQVSQEEEKTYPKDKKKKTWRGSRKGANDINNFKEINEEKREHLKQPYRVVPYKKNIITRKFSQTHCIQNTSAYDLMENKDHAGHLLEDNKNSKHPNTKAKKRSTMKYMLEDVNPLAFTEILAKSERGTQYSKLSRIIKIIDVILASILIGNIILTLIDNELYISNSKIFIENNMDNEHIGNLTIALLEKMGTRELTPTENMLRSINCLISISASILIVMHYKYQVNILQIDNRLSEYDGILSSGLYKHMFLEIVICMIFYPPGLNLVISGRLLCEIYVYNWNSIISVLALTKLYLIFRLISYCSRWTSETAQAVCRNNKVKPGIHFAIKCEMYKRPIYTLIFLFIIALAILGFTMRTFEYGVFHEETGFEGKKGVNDLQNLFNCIWLIVVTMTTVGYGDFYPRSHLGRFVGVIACIIGLLVLSLTVVTLNSITEFTTEEKKAYVKLKKLFSEENLENKAAGVIKTVFLLRYQVKKQEDDEKYIKHSKNVIFILLVQLKRNITVFKNDYKVSNSYNLPMDEMLKQIEDKLKADIKSITNNISHIRNIDKDLDNLAKRQDDIQTELKQITKMQEEVSKYLVNLNNKAFMAKYIKKKTSEEKHRPQCKSSSEIRIISSEDNLTNKQISGYCVFKEICLATIKLVHPNNMKSSKNIGVKDVKKPKKKKKHPKGADKFPSDHRIIPKQQSRKTAKFATTCLSKSKVPQSDMQNIHQSPECNNRHDTSSEKSKSNASQERRSQK